MVSYTCTYTILRGRSHTKCRWYIWGIHLFAGVYEHIYTCTLPTYLPAMKINTSTIGIRFAVLRKSTRLYLSLTLVACDKVWLVDSTAFACSSVVCRAFVALL